MNELFRFLCHEWQLEGFRLLAAMLLPSKVETTHVYLCGSLLPEDTLFRTSLYMEQIVWANENELFIV